MKDLISEIGYKSPVLPQSMYIFKNKRVGAEVCVIIIIIIIIIMIICNLKKSERFD